MRHARLVLKPLFIVSIVMSAWLTATTHATVGHGGGNFGGGSPDWCSYCGCHYSPSEPNYHYDTCPFDTQVDCYLHAALPCDNVG